MQDKINKLINDNPDVFQDAFLLRFPTDEELSDAEMRLGFEIPDEYVWFLKTYGHGGFFFELLGYGKNGVPVLVEKTLHERKNGMPANLLVIEDCDEYVVCIDIVTKKVVTWSKHDNDGMIPRADNFYTYFIDRVINAIDNY